MEQNDTTVIQPIAPYTAHSCPWSDVSSWSVCPDPLPRRAYWHRAVRAHHPGGPRMVGAGQWRGKGGHHTAGLGCGGASVRAVCAAAARRSVQRCTRLGWCGCTIPPDVRAGCVAPRVRAVCAPLHRPAPHCSAERCRGEHVGAGAAAPSL